jgi:hypothetical protein
MYVEREVSPWLDHFSRVDIVNNRFAPPAAAQPIHGTSATGRVTPPAAWSLAPESVELNALLKEAADTPERG